MKERNNKAEKDGLTQCIQHLHDMGYTYDYCASPESVFHCIQNNVYLSYEQVAIRLVGHFYDKFLRGYCYVHAVESETGEHGILLLPARNLSTRTFKEMSWNIDAFWDAF
jgi:hypothetical protein